MTTRNSDSATFLSDKGMVEGLVDSEDVESGWLRHGFFVWCGQPPRSRKWEMLSSTIVIAVDEIITYAVLGRVSNPTSVFRPSHSKCLYIGDGLITDEVKACGGAIIDTFGDRC